MKSNIKLQPSLLAKLQPLSSEHRDPLTCKSCNFSAKFFQYDIYISSKTGADAITLIEIVTQNVNQLCP